MSWWVSLSGSWSGAELWTLFARSLDAVPDPSVPVLSVVLVAVGALVFANLVAALPGHAARTPPGVFAFAPSDAGAARRLIDGGDAGYEVGGGGAVDP